MLTWSRRSKQIFRGRGVCGARKLIPMPQKISCAQALLTTGIRGLTPSASGYHPNLDPSSSP